VETSWPLQPVPFADIAPGFARDLHVTPNVRSELLNRSTNVVVSALALTVLLPLIALIALAVKMTSAGPVLYVQTRVGLDRRQRRTQSYDRRHHDRGGRLFTMYKFRTMRVDAESDGRAVWAQKNDARVTPLGRILRRTRLDELPQLYNVLRGEMNIVGPRPERPSIFERLRNDIPEYTVRQRVKPGITGWAQVNQSYDCSLDDVRRKVRHDIDYVQRQGLAEDLRIMCRTVPVMLFGKGGW
jgi:lipopolysaccharide/colanic/teichoic acid biosynthesis glycosyltransferase